MTVASNKPVTHSDTTWWALWGNMRRNDVIGDPVTQSCVLKRQIHWKHFSKCKDGVGLGPQNFSSVWWISCSHYNHLCVAVMRKWALANNCLFNWFSPKQLLVYHNCVLYWTIQFIFLKAIIILVIASKIKIIVMTMGRQ